MQTLNTLISKAWIVYKEVLRKLVDVETIQWPANEKAADSLSTKEPMFLQTFVITGVATSLSILFVILIIPPSLIAADGKDSRAIEDGFAINDSGSIRPTTDYQSAEDYALNCKEAIEAARDPATGVLPSVTNCEDRILPNMKPKPASVARSTVEVHHPTNAFMVTVEASDGTAWVWDGQALVLGVTH